MELNKPKRLVSVINGYEIGVESNNPKEDAATFELFIKAFVEEINKFVKKNEESVPVVAHAEVS